MVLYGAAHGLLTYIIFRPNSPVLTSVTAHPVYPKNWHPCVKAPPITAALDFRRFFFYVGLRQYFTHPTKYWPKHCSRCIQKYARGVQRARIRLFRVTCLVDAPCLYMSTFPTSLESTPRHRLPHCWSEGPYSDWHGEASHLIIASIPAHCLWIIYRVWSQNGWYMHWHMLFMGNIV